MTNQNINFDLSCFTDIDESLVETSSLLVKTSDSSVFTKNTNVVSNFDDVYVIECASVEEARYVYSYYVDKVDSISDFSKVMSIATDENDEVLLYAFSTKKGAQISPSSNILNFLKLLSSSAFRTNSSCMRNLNFNCFIPCRSINNCFIPCFLINYCNCFSMRNLSLNLFIITRCSNITGS